MKFHLAIAAIVFEILVTGAVASPAPDRDQDASRMSEYAATRPPIGYVQFCRQNPSECAFKAADPQRPVLSPARLRELVDVNAKVNREVIPVTDQSLYGVAELWTYPEGSGDCEDYVLLKRRLLIDRGWPASSLLITVVRDANGDGHAVLTVTTTAGDLVLDNQDTEIRAWRDTPYDYLKRQSRTDPNAWVSLHDEMSKSQFLVGGTVAR
jgi:predicted transglutaminase-like cysteine proteinase